MQVGVRGCHTGTVVLGAIVQSPVPVIILIALYLVVVVLPGGPPGSGRGTDKDQSVGG